jgi:hypothetical protein
VSDVDVAGRSGLLFRAVNERIFEIGANDVEGLEILCECGDESCISTVVITVRDYERLRRDSSRFVVCGGHERADIERVTERTPEYLVVERPDERPTWSCAASAPDRSLAGAARSQVVHGCPQRLDVVLES